ncbi:hypothetical protein [Riemerella anatipestifer]|uniref:Uncharacterized protein n=1 Tax=Riemerella anatipestifer TaxID=34085 RepID=A0AAP6HFR5_RIEAN|nr:hypothetical protein [Riemerella anatipestifer]MBT0548440.1 hypothetical protein [Riemerella anatipestifer]MBT0555672.1 hypothetical protein [Riemerella anatipestifer]MBT0559203.1 hypothetical protein [Riemerella anatipestifer]MCD5967722.1 hypothetical protein [Riemerella anatipestifer]MCO7355250.1 hypothetical protein [Riemerella anatipestifer]
MKIIKEILKYLTLVFLLLILFKLTKYYGDYVESVYDIIIIPFVFCLILVNGLILYFYQKRRKKLRTLKLICLFGMTGVLFNIFNNCHSKNREEVSTYFIGTGAYFIGAEEKTKITLFENQTFQITEYSPHTFHHWNGKCKISNDTLYLRNIDFERLSYLQLTDKYLYNTNTKNFFSEGYSPLIKKE